MLLMNEPSESRIIALNIQHHPLTVSIVMVSSSRRDPKAGRAGLKTSYPRTNTGAVASTIGSHQNTRSIQDGQNGEPGVSQPIFVKIERR